MSKILNAESFIEHLPAQGSKKQGHLYTKSIGPARLTVDTLKQTLHFPEGQGLVINERQTCNFSSPENFVVFECVHRFLEKGYLAKHIKLEPKWKLGHGSSGGRADILIRDDLTTPLLIIECKTGGSEFDRAWSSSCINGLLSSQQSTLGALRSAGERLIGDAVERLESLAGKG